MLNNRLLNLLGLLNLWLWDVLDWLDEGKEGSEREESKEDSEDDENSSPGSISGWGIDWEGSDVGELDVVSIIVKVGVDVLEESCSQNPWLIIIRGLLDEESAAASSLFEEEVI